MDMKVPTVGSLIDKPESFQRKRDAAEKLWVEHGINELQQT